MEEVLILLRGALEMAHQNLEEGLIVFESDQKELAQLVRQLQAIVYEYELFEIGD